jgi:hypothetical protein
MRDAGTSEELMRKALHEIEEREEVGGCLGTVRRLTPC